MASSTHIYYSAATLSDSLSSSNSHVPPARGPFPSPYYVSERTTTLDAFAEVNRALHTQNARQSMPRRVPQGPREPRFPNPEIPPQRPRTLRMEQLPQDASQLYPAYMHAHINPGYDVVNPRFSTASSPAVLYPGMPASPPNNSRETGRYDAYPRGRTSEGHARPARPTLKVITPSNPQWKAVNAAPRRERTFQDMGYQTTSLKDRSSCVIM